MYSCKRCGYNAPQKLALKKHYERKTPCDAKVADLNKEQLLADFEQTYVIGQPVPQTFNCSKCGRVCKTVNSKTRHENACNVVNQPIPQRPQLPLIGVFSTDNIKPKEYGPITRAEYIKQLDEQIGKLEETLERRKRGDNSEHIERTIEGVDKTIDIVLLIEKDNEFETVRKLREYDIIAGINGQKNKKLILPPDLPAERLQTLRQQNEQLRHVLVTQLHQQIEEEKRQFEINRRRLHMEFIEFLEFLKNRQKVIEDSHKNDEEKTTAT